MPSFCATERVGSTVLGKYLLRRVLGQGGMGVVYEAEHLKLRRPVAIKFLLPALASDATVVARFLNEARTATQLRHPNIVDVIDIDSAEDGAPFLVMELLQGESLAQRMRGARMSAQEVFGLLEPAMEALCLAHEQGIVHRDLKPDNVFLHRVGGRVVAKVLDFGIAKILHEGAAPLTASGAVLGTIAYMPPEQAGGKNVGPWSDVWSMGVILFESLSGRLPYDFDPDAPATAQLIKLVMERPISLRQAAPELGEELPAIIDCALTHDASQRFQSMAALLGALRDAMRKRPAFAATVPTPQHDAPPRSATSPGAEALPKTAIHQTPPTRPGLAMPQGAAIERAEPAPEEDDEPLALPTRYGVSPSFIVPVVVLLVILALVAYLSRDRWSMSEPTADAEALESDPPVAPPAAAPPSLPVPPSPPATVEDPAHSHAAPSAEELRAQVVAARGRMARCARGESARIEATVTVLGATGRVRDVRLADHGAQAATGACVAGILEQLSFDPFTDESVTFQVPVVLAAQQ